jgi:hypothetical protein
VPAGDHRTYDEQGRAEGQRDRRMTTEQSTTEQGRALVAGVSTPWREAASWPPHCTRLRAAPCLLLQPAGLLTARSPASYSSTGRSSGSFCAVHGRELESHPAAMAGELCFLRDPPAPEPWAWTAVMHSRLSFKSSAPAARGRPHQGDLLIRRATADAVVRPYPLVHYVAAEVHCVASPRQSFVRPGRHTWTRHGGRCAGRHTLGHRARRRSSGRTRHRGGCAVSRHTLSPSCGRQAVAAGHATAVVVLVG